MDTEPLHPTTVPLTRDIIASHTRTSEILDDEERTHLASGELPCTESNYRHGPRDDYGRTAPSVVDKAGRITDVAEAELTSMVSTALRVDTKMCHRGDIFSNEHGSGSKAKRISPSYDMPKVGGHHHLSDRTEREHLLANNYPIPPKQGKFASDRSSFSPYRNDDCHCHSHAITPVSTWDGSLTTCPCPEHSLQHQPDTPSVYPRAVHHRDEQDEDDEDLELAWIQSSTAPTSGGASSVISSSARPSGRRNPAIPGDENTVVPSSFFGHAGSLSLPSPSSSKLRMSSRNSSSSSTFWGRTGAAARRRSSSSGGIRGILLDATNVRPPREFEPVVGTARTTPREKAVEDSRSPTSIATTTRGGGTTAPPGGGAAGRRRARAGFF